MTSAFAISPTFAPSASSFTGQQLSPIQAPHSSYGPRMALLTQKKPKTKSSFPRLEENRAAKLAAEYRGPQGFTPYAEKVNGRLAQVGFMIGLITEVVSGKPIGQQMLIMFSPLTHALQAVLGVVTK